MKYSGRRATREGAVGKGASWRAPFPPALSRFSRLYDTSCKLDVNSPYAHHCFSQRDAWVRGRPFHLRTFLEPKYSSFAMAAAAQFGSRSSTKSAQRYALIMRMIPSRTFLELHCFVMLLWCHCGKGGLATFSKIQAVTRNG